MAMSLIVVMTLVLDVSIGQTHYSILTKPVNSRQRNVEHEWWTSNTHGLEEPEFSVRQAIGKLVAVTSET